MSANGEVQTTEETQENVHDLDLFVTVQIFEDTPAVLSLGKLCEDPGYPMGGPVKNVECSSTKRTAAMGHTLQEC